LDGLRAQPTAGTFRAVAGAATEDPEAGRVGHADAWQVWILDSRVMDQAPGKFSFA
jgi:hypothetical protein